MEHNLRSLWFFLLITFSSNSASSKQVCGKDIDAAFQRLENPRFVFLISGSHLWEFDREEDDFVQNMVPIKQYFKGAPKNPDLAYISDKNGHLIIFVKNHHVDYFNCTKRTEDCAYIGGIDLDKRFNDRRVNLTFDAGFGYTEAMPKPKTTHGTPYVAHLFNKEREEFDCRRVTKHEGTYESICDLAIVDKDLFPNYYRLNPKGEEVYAAEAFYNRTTNMTDFFIVVNRSIRYTINGHIKIRKCGNLRALLLVVIVPLLILVQAGLVVLAAVTFTKHRSMSSDETKVKGVTKSNSSTATKHDKTPKIEP